MIEVNKIINKIIEKSSEIKVAALHDYFIDHFIYMEEDIEELTINVIETAKRGGGNIFRNKQEVIRGGCASNFSAAISQFGVKVKLITFADRIGFEILKRDASKVDLSNVKICEDQAYTTIIESNYHGRKVNIMISYPGILSNFNIDKLDEKDWEIILKSDFVCMFTWNVNLKGNELIEGVSRRVKENGVGKIYIDLGDPRLRIEDLKNLVNKVMKNELIDALSLNENELNVISKIVFGGEGIESIYEDDKLINLSRELNTRLDVHTPECSATIYHNKVIRAPCFKVKVLRTTGAGDAWNAGNILGWGSELDDYSRILVANAIAAIYISKEKTEHPNIWELKEFMNKWLK